MKVKLSISLDDEIQKKLDAGQKKLGVFANGGK
ncbi:MAG: hypothetical protein QS98_C0008G0010 [archaeon GW2011_AR3]|nr:MAG: hypothetical protein QS98_C0008G0010 [archaeon GW2011_AR3]